MVGFDPGIGMGWGRREALMRRAIWFAVVFSAFSSPVRADPACRNPEPAVPASLRSIHTALEANQATLPFDRIGSDTPSYTASQRLMGFSYYVGIGNERFEKLEGYDDSVFAETIEGPQFCTCQEILYEFCRSPTESKARVYS